MICDNLIIENSALYAGGGIYAGPRSAAIIERNFIADNTALGWGGGGITLWNWHALDPISKQVRNNVVARNRATSAGGGFYIRYDRSILENNTVVDNDADQRGGGAYVLNRGTGDSPLRVRNSIIWGNTSNQGASIDLDARTGSAIVVSFSAVEGGWNGRGNMSSEPEFADDWLSRYSLAADSPCIDRGDPHPSCNDRCLPPSRGTARNDMGAYGGPSACGEVGQSAINLEAIPSGHVAAPSPPRLLGSHPNPFGQSTVLCYELQAPVRVELSIYSITGRLVRRLIADEVQTVGRHQIEWDGHDATGRRVSSGIYWCRLRAGGTTTSSRIVVLR
jgi:parallel beta-helix repeat protein